MQNYTEKLKKKTTIILANKIDTNYLKHNLVYN